MAIERRVSAEAMEDHPAAGAQGATRFGEDAFLFVNRKRRVERAAKKDAVGLSIFQRNCRGKWLAKLVFPGDFSRGRLLRGRGIFRRGVVRAP